MRSTMKAVLIQRALLTILAHTLLLWLAVQGVHGTGNDESVGDPLYLTPLINSGRLNEARSRSQTGRIGGDELEYVLGYSGYFTVNSEFNSNLFFWFVPAMERPEQAPVLAWLQGGPGSSSLLGFFAEHGPYGLQDGNPPVPVRRPITWCQYFSIIYVDEPVGAGYSFTESEQGYARNLTDLARDMVEFLQQFFTLFPEFGARDFYVTGESFGGKFVPATAYALHQAGDSLRVKINLKGIAFGNGITDPPSMIDYGPHLYFLGLVDRKQAAYFDQQRDVALDLMENGRYVEATLVMNDLIFNLPNELYNSSYTYYTNVTGYDNYYNLLTINKYLIDTLYKKFAQTPTMRRAVHVGENAFNDRTKVVTHMMGDILRSAKRFMPALMENYKVLVYSGHLDIAVAYTATAQFVERIPWSGADAFAAAQRKIWRPRTKPWSRESYPESAVFGYTRRAKDFREVMIRDAGHLVPHDQPEAALDMLMRFIYDLPFADGEEIP
uniref:Putative serine carboxypeptidase n=1 Tax=Rhipicephalus microplus TaxID=6941 RepID=A0A6M2D556_RHIMP